MSDAGPEGAFVFVHIDERSVLLKPDADGALRLWLCRRYQDAADYLDHPVVNADGMKVDWDTFEIVWLGADQLARLQELVSLPAAENTL